MLLLLIHIIYISVSHLQNNTFSAKKMFSNREEINYSSVFRGTKDIALDMIKSYTLSVAKSIALLYSSIIPEIFRLCRRLRVYPHLFLPLSLLFCVSLIHVIFEHLPPVATMLIEILFAFGFINFEDSRNLLHILVVNSLFASQFQLFQNESRFPLPSYWVQWPDNLSR